MRLVEPQEPTLPFGLGPDPTTTRLQLQPGDRLYTDGLIETRAAGERHFVAIEDVTPGLAALPVEDALDDVMQRLRTAAAGPLADDLALLLIEYQPEPADVRRTLDLQQPANLMRY